MEGRSAVAVVVVVVAVASVGVDTGSDANTGVTRALPVAERDRKDRTKAVFVGRDMLVYRVIKQTIRVRERQRTQNYYYSNVQAESGRPKNVTD